ncbi:MAG: hypothetical protein ABIJ08_00750 [Nanoarchaeota archaeon]
MIKKKPKNIFFILFFDIIFIIIFLVLGKTITNFLPTTQEEIQIWITNSGINPGLIIIAVLVYNLILLFTYSLFKLSILSKVANYDKAELKPNRVVTFFFLNLSIFLTSIILFIIISGIFYSIFTTEFFKIFAIIFVIAYAILFYLFINMNHSFFIKEDSIKRVLGKSISMLFKGIKKYYGVLLWVLILSIAYTLFSYILGNIAKAINMSQSTYTIIYIVISSILFYSIIFVNRVYFYLIMKKS